MNQDEFDQEGRLITAEFSDHYLITCYTPNSQRGLARLSYRLRWEDAFRAYLLDLSRKSRLFFVGI